VSVERRTRKDGTVAFVCRHREGGKNRARVFDTRRDALAFDAEVRRRRRMGEVGMLDYGRKTLAELHQAWVETHGADLSPKTMQGYGGAWRTLLEPHLGSSRLSEVTPLAVERWARARLAAGTGEASLEKAWLLLSSVMGRGEAWGWIAKNPVRLAKRPKKRNARRVPTVLSPAEVEAVRAAMPRQIDAALVSLLAYAGLRPGEALALRWSDVGRDQITVSKALSLGEVKGTKTGRSRRVPLVSALRSDLLQWRFASEHSGHGDLVFPNFTGENWREPDWRAWGGRRFKPALEAAGLRREVRPYDLRHSAASMLLKSGLNVIEVAARMGHSPQMTLSTYAHVLADFDGVAFDMEEEIRKARETLAA
jgi:integrase